MATAQLDTVIRHLRRAMLRQDGAGKSDGQLLALFIEQKDEAAFEALVRRHGPMVFGVCRRVVGNHHDAEDAFQATFLVLARKASSVRPRERVANWLHGVALRTAMKAKAMIAKRRGREKQVTEMPEVEADQQDQWRDLQPLLDRELNGLPESYRFPILFCDLQGKTIRDAAQQLGWPQGTLAGRLARGRKLLAKRLANRGVVLSAGSLTAVVSQNAGLAAVPTSLVSSTVKAAAIITAGQAAVAGMVPAQVAALTEGVLKAMLLTKFKSVLAVTMAMAVTVGIGVGLLGYGRATGQQKENNKGEVVAPNKEVAKSDKDNLLGKWLLISAECRGKDRMLPCFKDNTLLVIEEVDGKLVGKTVFKDKAKVLAEFAENRQIGEDIEKMTEVALKLDARTKPKTLDGTGVHGTGTCLGIYKLDGDTLTWCMGTDKERPTDFSTKSGDGRSLSVYKRQKETEPKRRNSSPLPAKEADAGKTDLDRLQGVWSAIWMEHDGERHRLEGTVFMVDGKRACLQSGNRDFQGGLYLNATRTPKTYDLAMSTRTIEGIYLLKGDTLKLCWDWDADKKRPSGFLTEKGSGQCLVMFQRTSGPEVFPYRLADGTRAFPTIIEKAEPTPLPQIAPQPSQGKKNVPDEGKESQAKRIGKPTEKNTSTPSSDYLRGLWEGEKNGIKVKFTFSGDKAHWQVEYRKTRKPKEPYQSPEVGVGITADLKCVPDEKGGRWNLYLPTYLGDDPKIKKYPVLTGHAPVGEITRGAEGTIPLRIIPTGWEDLDRDDYDYPAVEGLILHRKKENGEQVKADRERLQGTWVLVSQWSDGKEDDKEELKKIGRKITFRGEQFVISERRLGQTRRGSYKINPQEKPKSLDVTVEEGRDEKKFIRAIYKIEGDTLTICEGRRNDRPVGFTTEGAGAGNLLSVFQREQSK